MPKRHDDTKLRKSSAPAYIAEAICEAIFKGDLLPGDPILETHKADLYKVSQSTVREALLQLEHVGLVRRVRNVGTLVTQMSPREIQERLRLRVTLEALAVIDAARLARPEQLERIEAALQKFRQAITDQSHFEAAHADLDFHRVIWEASGDNMLYQILDQLTVPLFAFVAMERRRRGERRPDADVANHGLILNAIRERDPVAAETAIRRHFEPFYGDFPGSGYVHAPVMEPQTAEL